jgi:N-acetyl-anhydromuramyl-L-alanine amidase AmpD
VVLLLLMGLLFTAQTYTDEDIDAMKARYQPKTLKRGNLPPEYFERAYEAPRLVDWMLPYQDWEEEYRNYFQRHYHDPSLTFKPSAIVMHYTVTPDAFSVRKSFLRGCNMSNGDKGTVFGHVSVQLMIGPTGTVYQLLPLDRRCTGAYGVNHVALSIEMVARNENELMSRPKQLWSSFCLVRYLMRRFDIPANKVYAHYEVSTGVSVVPEYTDYNDETYPDCYPPSSARSDPGPNYMRWLRQYLAKTGPAPEE